jgi:hypothetical protein
LQPALNRPYDGDDKEGTRRHHGASEIDGSENRDRGDGKQLFSSRNGNVGEGSTLPVFLLL